MGYERYKIRIRITFLNKDLVVDQGKAWEKEREMHKERSQARQQQEKGQSRNKNFISHVLQETSRFTIQQTVYLPLYRSLDTKFPKLTKNNPPIAH